MVIRAINNPSDSVSILLPIDIYVHKHLETFIASRVVNEGSVPVSLVYQKDINAIDNISIVDRSDYLNENSLKKTNTNEYKVISGASYTTYYNNLFITDVFDTDNKGNYYPYFYAEDLPIDASSIIIEKNTIFGKQIIKNGYKLSEDNKRIYYSFVNNYDFRTGEYVVYFISCKDDSGNIYKGLINPTSAVRESTWEDLDSETGEININYPVWYKETVNNENTYFFSESKTYLIKLSDASVITPLEFSNGLAEDGWFPIVKAGAFSHINKGNELDIYTIPELNTMSYIPYSPWLFDSFSSYRKLTKNIIFLGRNDLGINDTDRPLRIIIRDKYDVVLYALTTCLEDDLDTFEGSIKWDSNKIASYDNFSGLVEITIDILFDWNLEISYYYKNTNYSYSYFNLNPLYNSDVHNYFYVLYMKPNESTRSLHHLKVRTDGVIVDCSDENFSLSTDDVYNSNNFINLIYRDDATSYENDDWVSLYSVEGLNSYNYLIVAEYFFSEIVSYKDIKLVEVSRSGDSIAPSKKEEAMERNQNLIQSKYLSTDVGLEYSKNNTLVIRSSYSVLEEYGGTFSLEEYKKSLYKYIGVGKYLLFEWDEDIIDITIYNNNPNEISFTWKNIGNAYSYKIYRSYYKDIGFELLGTIEGSYNITYTDTSPETGKVYYYYIVPAMNGVDFPQSYTFGAKSR